MLRIINFCLLFFLTNALLSGQEGTITFNRKYHWVNIVTKMPFLSQEEKDRIKLSWGNESENKGEDFILTFNKEGSTYIRKEKTENYGYSWDEEEDIFIRDHIGKKTKDIRILLGKKYIIEDEIPKMKWKILNELKDIEGYVCMKAETKDTVNNVVIHAWFTDKIPVMSGPEGFSGLPGMILALDFNDDDVNIVATKVDMAPQKPVVLPIPQKIKGKSILYAEFYSRKKKHINLSVQGRRNPYWDVRY
ncbi:MAG: GLPGLI family protein [Saprospiraceae bacterium]|jgi:GLPGLI family protein|nr:GLPGLI family protein [Saprospiraceae bacterium]